MTDETSNERKLIEPRLEAQLLETKQLTSEQLKAASNVVALLRWYAKKADSKPKEDQWSPYRLDARRRSHVLLIDGGRGSGKTSLLVSLINQWQNVLRDAQAKDGWEKIVDDDLLVVPLELIDLGALPTSASLILHVASLMRRLVGRMAETHERDQERDGPLPWSPSDVRGLESGEKWGPFLRAAALGWDGNLRAREQHLDSETFVAELEMNETDRLDIRPAFEDFATALLEDYKKHGNHHRRLGGDPVFVVPIDDVDMSPDRVMELFRVLTVVRHPRVVFLLAGDSDLFRAILKVYFAGAIREPAERSNLALEELTRLGVDQHVLKLARRMYDKLVPPAHRFELGEIGPAQRLRHLQTAADQDPDVESFFSQHAQTRLALPAAMRALRDLGEWLRELRGDETRLARLAHRLWNDALDDDEVLTSAEREKLGRAVRLAEGSLAAALEGSALQVTHHPIRNVFNPWPLRVPGAVEGRVGAVEVRFHAPQAEPVATVLRERDRGIVPGAEDTLDEVVLSPRTTAAWLLALAVSGTQTDISQKTTEENIKLVEVSTPEGEVAWPLPRFEHRTELVASLSSFWVEQVNQYAGLPKAELTLASYARGFLGVVLHVIQGRDDGDYTWDHLAKRLVEVPNAPGGVVGEDFEWTREQAPLLAAPESGVEAGEARKFLESLRAAAGDAAWSELKKKLVARRTRWLRGRKASPRGDHPWFELVDPSQSSKLEGSVRSKKPTSKKPTPKKSKTKKKPPPKKR